MKKPNKTITKFRPMLLSRHPSHNILRAKNKNIELLPYRSVIRLGSTTNIPDTIANGGDRIEVNSVESIKNSASKLRMKRCFTAAGVKTAEWYTLTNRNNTIVIKDEVSNQELAPDEIEYPIVAKSHFGSRGDGNTLIKSEQEFSRWTQGKRLDNYILEVYKPFALEFRLHITEDGCFYTCRKALKKDTPEEEKWHRHDDTSIWLLESNPDFRKPNSWNDIVADCVKALKSVGADVLSFDVRVQSEKNSKGKAREYQDFVVLECNSASSMDNGTNQVSVCAQKYIAEIPKIIKRKANESISKRTTRRNLG